MRGWLAVSFGVITFVATGCNIGDTDDLDGGQQGEEGARCDAVATDVLDAGEASELGFGGDAILALAGGSHTATLTWAGGGTTDLAVDVVDPGEIRFEDREWVDDGSGLEAALDCADVVVVEATLSLTTGDGALAETFDLGIEASTADEASFWQDLDLDALNGTFSADDVTDTSRFDGVSAYVSGTFDAGGAHGSIDGQGTSTDGDGPDGTASAEFFAIGEW